jgi:hypothetical protein
MCVRVGGAGLIQVVGELLVGCWCIMIVHHDRGRWCIIKEAVVIEAVGLVDRHRPLGSLMVTGRWALVDGDTGHLMIVDDDIGRWRVGRRYPQDGENVSDHGQETADQVWRGAGLCHHVFLPPPRYPPGPRVDRYHGCCLATGCLRYAPLP